MSSAGGARRIVFMYSGQGAQYYQMGRALFDADPAYRDALLRAEAVCGPIEGRRISELLFSRPIGDSDRFDRLGETHPVLLAVAWALTEALAARGVRPDVTVGYSRGETIAAVVTGALSLDQAFWALRAQAALYERAAPPGRLVAVLGPRTLLEEAETWSGRAHLAAVNGPGHIVVALSEADVPASLAGSRRASSSTPCCPCASASIRRWSTRSSKVSWRSPPSSALVGRGFR